MLDLFIKTVLHLGTFLKDSENVRSGPLNRTPWFQNSEIIIKKVNFANFPKLESRNEKESNLIQNQILKWVLYSQFIELSLNPYLRHNI